MDVSVNTTQGEGLHYHQRETRRQSALLENKEGGKAWPMYW
jgi:hypothetical protein